MQQQLTLTQSDLDAILRGDRFVEEDGHKVLGIGLTALFLFREGHTRAKRRAVCQCVEEFLKFVRPYLRWQTVDGESAVNLSQAEPDSIEALAEKSSERKTWSVVYSSGDDIMDASAFQVDFMCLASWKPVGISQFSIQLPLSYLNADFIGRFHRFASLLEVNQAYAGVGILQRPDAASAAPYIKHVYSLSRQYPGLEVLSPLHTFESNNLRDAMRCINWLTAVGNEFLEKLGGVDRICQGMNQQILVFRYEGGVLFQAGAKPELGNGEKNIVPLLYQEVARVLRPVRLQELKSRFLDFDSDETMKWLARFD